MRNHYTPERLAKLGKARAFVLLNAIIKRSAASIAVSNDKSLDIHARAAGLIKLWECDEKYHKVVKAYQIVIWDN